MSWCSYLQRLNFDTLLTYAAISIMVVLSLVVVIYFAHSGEWLAATILAIGYAVGIALIVDAASRVRE